jgi:multidrug resistance efflux pump
MNAKTKLALIGGFSVLGLIAGALIIYLNWTYAATESNRAQLTLQTYTVGTSYAGIITKQTVSVGDSVVEGQTLFEIKSDELTQQLLSTKALRSNLMYPLGSDGQILVTASRPGVVRQIDYNQGSFVGAYKQLASIADTTTIGVAADFTVNKSQLNRLTAATPVRITLPSGKALTGRITSISQSIKDNQSVTTVKASLPVDAGAQLYAASGTAVSVKLTFDQHSWYSQIKDYARGLLARKN